MSMMNTMMDSMIGGMEKSEKETMMKKMMPMMMKEIKKSDMTEFLREKFLKMIFKVHPSRLDFYGTVNRVLELGKENNWHSPQIVDHYRLEKELCLDDPNKVATVSMCIPKSAHLIVKDQKRLAAMMPLQINVYEDADEVYICWMNIGSMGKMFGKKIADIMNEADRNLTDILKNMFKEEEV